MLDYEKIPKYKYRLRGDFVYVLEDGSFGEVLVVKSPFISILRGELKLVKGYAWDGCTYFPDLRKLMRASVVHDAFCQLINKGYLSVSFQPEADLLFYKIAVEDGFNKSFAKLAYYGIRVYQTLHGKGGCAK